MFQVLLHTFGYSCFHPNFWVWRRGWCTSTFSSDNNDCHFSYTIWPVCHTDYSAHIAMVNVSAPWQESYKQVIAGSNYCQLMYDLTLLRVNVNIVMIVYLFVMCNRNQRTFRPKKSTPSGSKVWYVWSNFQKLEELVKNQVQGGDIPNIMLCIGWKCEVINLAWIFFWVLAGCCSSQAHWCHSWKWQSERGCAPPSGWRSLWVVGSEQYVSNAKYNYNYFY